MEIQTTPKPINYFPLWVVITLLAALFSFAGGVAYTHSQRPLVDLPEEASLIKSTDNLKGHWEGNTLYIEFNNPLK